MAITIRPATPNELDTVTALHAEITAWLASQGLDQWQPKDGQAEQLRRQVREEFRTSIERGECYIAHMNGEAVGTITIDHLATRNFGYPPTIQIRLSTSIE